MKKVSGLLVIAIVLATFSSCKKNYNCVCTSTSGGQNTTILANQKHRDAKNNCAAMTTTYKSCALQ